MRQPWYASGFWNDEQNPDQDIATRPLSNDYNVEVVVEPHYLPEHSNPDESEYAFSYQVAISNFGHQSVQLISRHWIITNADGEVELPLAQAGLWLVKSVYMQATEGADQNRGEWESWWASLTFERP